MKFFYSAIILFLLACNDKTVAKKDTAFTFYPENPELVYFYDDWKQQLIENCRLFNLPVLFSGTDSLELRVWYWMAFDPHKKLLRFKLDSTGWKGTNYYSYSVTIGNQDGINFKAPDPKKWETKFSWQKAFLH